MRVTSRSMVVRSAAICVCLVSVAHARSLGIRSPNLEPSRGGLSPALVLVYAGGNKLLSQGYTVTSSGAEPCRGELAFITDGDKACDENESTIVKITQGVQWVQIALEASQVINAQIKRVSTFDKWRRNR